MEQEAHDASRATVVSLSGGRLGLDVREQDRGKPRGPVAILDREPLNVL
jgi:hypothetical protein